MRTLVSGVCCLVLVGCGSGGGQGVTLPAGTSTTAAQGTDSSAQFSYRGTTSQRRPVTIAVGNGNALGKFRVNIRCQDGGSSVAAIATSPHQPKLQPDGSFYYSETGNADFSGFGNGRYRVAVAGQLQGNTGAGHASFRISFKSTTCRSAVSWQVKRVQS